MNRTEFIKSCGATCSNWLNSWSFVNHGQKTIIFGAWDVWTEETSAMILSDEWEFGKGRRRPAYKESLQHIRLIENEGYALKTFAMRQVRNANGSVKIGGFTQQLIEKKLAKVAGKWYAVDLNGGSRTHLPEEIIDRGVYSEGAPIKIIVNSYERDPAAKEACKRHHGHNCAVCGMNFGTVYGLIAKNYIHVHHIIPISERREAYTIDPIKDLIPVCPNCHAVIHLTSPPMTVEQLRNHLLKKS